MAFNYHSYLQSGDALPKSTDSENFFYIPNNKLIRFGGSLQMYDKDDVTKGMITETSKFPDWVDSVRWEILGKSVTYPNGQPFFPDYQTSHQAAYAPNAHYEFGQTPIATGITLFGVTGKAARASVILDSSKMPSGPQAAKEIRMLLGIDDQFVPPNSSSSYCKGGVHSSKLPPGIHYIQWVTSPLFDEYGGKRHPATGQPFYENEAVTLKMEPGISSDAWLATVTGKYATTSVYFAKSVTKEHTFTEKQMNAFLGLLPPKSSVLPSMPIPTGTVKVTSLDTGKTQLSTLVSGNVYFSPVGTTVGGKSEFVLNDYTKPGSVYIDIDNKKLEEYKKLLESTPVYSKSSEPSPESAKKRAKLQTEIFTLSEVGSLPETYLASSPRSDLEGKIPLNLANPKEAFRFRLTYAETVYLYYEFDFILAKNYVVNGGMAPSKRVPRTPFVPAWALPEDYKFLHLDSASLERLIEHTDNFMEQAVFGPKDAPGLALTKAITDCQQGAVKLGIGIVGSGATFGSGVKMIFAV